MDTAMNRLNKGLQFDVRMSEIRIDGFATRAQDPFTFQA